MKRIYLDNAATSWPKPEVVYEATDRYQREIGGPAGRSAYRTAVEVDRLIGRARIGLGRLVGLDDPTRVIFTYSGTDSLNLAIQGIVRPGDHVVTTACEHNSVLRPLRYLADSAQVSVTYVPCDGAGFVSPDDVRRAIKPNTRLVAIIHGSNVTGAIQPIDEIGQVVHQQGAFYLVDAAQTLGEVPISLAHCRADMIAAPGHKALLGPLGTGVLYLSERAAEQMRPLRFGGTGTSSELDRQPEELPHRFEPGNVNVPGIVGLGAAVEFLNNQAVTKIRHHHKSLASQLIDGLARIDGVTLHGPIDTGKRTSVVSFTMNGYDPQEFAAVLEMTSGIECRAGLHCAPRMNDSLGTLAGGGTVRLSPGWSTTSHEIDTVLEAISQAALATVL